MKILVKMNNDPLTKPLRIADFRQNRKIMQVKKFKSKMKVKCFGKPHFA